MDAADEIYINWGNEQLLWHQHWFGVNFTPITRIENISIAEAFFNNSPERSWSLVSYSVAEIMLQTQNVKISQLDDPVPNREIQFISNIPVKQQFHDYLYEDIIDTLSKHRGFTMIENSR